MSLHLPHALPTVGTVHAGPGDLDDADKNGRVKYEAPLFDVKAERRVVPFTALEGARAKRHGLGRPIGVVDEGGKLLKIALLGGDGRVVRLIERVERRSFDSGPQPVDALKSSALPAASRSPRASSRRWPRRGRT